MTPAGPGRVLHTTALPDLLRYWSPTGPMAVQRLYAAALPLVQSTAAALSLVQSSSSRPTLRLAWPVDRENSELSDVVCM